MRSLKYLVGASLISVASIGLFTACGDDTEGNNATTGCVLDGECGDGNVCEAETCVATCASDEECGDGEVCGARMNGDGMICVPDTTTDCNDETDPNAFCEGELGAGAFCDAATGECEVPEEQVYIAQIADVTTVAAACEESTDPGSDIQGIELQDAMGNTLGWGNIVSEAVIEEGNDELNYGVINGAAPTLDGDGCVDEFTGNVLSLGCTGSIAVEFLDEAEAPVALADGQTIFVYEYGGVCSTGTTDDEWTVFTCSDTDAVSGGDFESCSNTLGSGSGVGSVGVTLPGA